MKVIVTYLSGVCNTKKVAEAILDEISCTKDIRPMSEVKNLDCYDVAFVGFPIQAYHPSGEARIFFERYAQGRNVALFITHATPEGHPGLVESLEKCKQVANGANVLGIFACQGGLSHALTDLLSKSGDMSLIEATKIYSFSAGQPDARKLRKARTFARRMVKKCMAA